MFIELHIACASILIGNPHHTHTHTQRRTCYLLSQPLWKQQCQHRVNLIFQAELCIRHGRGLAWLNTSCRKGENLCLHLPLAPSHIWSFGPLGIRWRRERRELKGALSAEGPGLNKDEFATLA